MLGTPRLLSPGMMGFHGCGFLLFPWCLRPGDTPFIPFTGALKSPALASQSSQDSAVEEDHVPLQLLESH